MPEYTDAIARPKRKAINCQPLLCGICGAEQDGTDAEIKRLNRARHIRSAHGIRPCEPDYYEQ